MCFFRSNLVCLLFLIVFWIKCARPEEIVYLPGEKESVKQYSGYLDVSEGKKLFYWLVLSENSYPAIDPNAAWENDDPLILYLNGGPGCSSLYGALVESGPQLVADKTGNTLRKNEFSWNKLANVLYLESPAEVGFSHNTKRLNETSDPRKATAELNLEALQDFFKKYPQFKRKYFYIFGVSYGGVYAPMLSELIMNSDLRLNFKGISIGNGFLNSRIIAHQQIQFLLDHGLLDKDTLANMTSSNDCYSNPNKECNLVQNRMEMIKVLDPNQTLNIHNINHDCKERHMDENGTVSCFPYSGITNYLNRLDVQMAINTGAQFGNRGKKWTPCSNAVYMRFAGSFGSFTGINMAKQIKQAVNNDKKVVIFNGDSDLICPYTSAKEFVKGLDLEEENPFQLWSTKDKNNEDQVAGSIIRYKNLDLVTIKGGGHSATESNPREVFYMLKRYLFNKQ